MTRTLFGLRFSLFVFTVLVATGSILAQEGAKPAQPAPAAARRRRLRRPTCHCGRTAMPSRARRRPPQCRRRRMMDRRKRWRAAQASSRSRRFATASDRRTGIPAITPRCPRSSRAAARTATSAPARSATIPTEKGARKTRQSPACRLSYFVQQMARLSRWRAEERRPEEREHHRHGRDRQGDDR